MIVDIFNKNSVLQAVEQLQCNGLEQHSYRFHPVDGIHTLLFSQSRSNCKTGTDVQALQATNLKVLQCIVTGKCALPTEKDRHDLASKVLNHLFGLVRVSDNIGTGGKG